MAVQAGLLTAARTKADRSQVSLPTRATQSSNLSTIHCVRATCGVIHCVES
jgi:hypothetical protein